MNILINASNLKFGGALQVASSFIDYIIQNDLSDNIIIVISSQVEENLNIKKKSLKVYVNNLKGNALNSIIGRNKFLDHLVLENKIETVFTIFGPSYWHPKCFHVCGFAKPEYVFKNSPYFKLLSFYERVILRIKESFHLYSFRNHCNLLVTENPAVSEKIEAITGIKTYTVSNYYHQIFDEGFSNTAPKKKDVNNFLFPAAFYKHKNHNILEEVIQELNSNYPSLQYCIHLTIDRGDLQFKDVDNYRFIKFHGKVNISEMRNIYYQIDFLFLPTLLECFSASYCEAMVMKKPILTSDLEFARGICGESAIYFDPLNAKNIADKIWGLVHDLNLQSRLIKNGLNQLKKFDNYESRARKYLRIIKQKSI